MTHLGAAERLKRGYTTGLAVAKVPPLPQLKKYEKITLMFIKTALTDRPLNSRLTAHATTNCTAKPCGSQIQHVVGSENATVCEQRREGFSPSSSRERLTAHGSRLTAHGSRLTAHGKYTHRLINRVNYTIITFSPHIFFSHFSEKRRIYAYALTTAFQITNKKGV
jgi:hypothetical protein